MSDITDKPLMEACSNGDGTYSLIPAVQWLTQTFTGKPMSFDTARKLVAEAQEHARKKRAQEGNG